MIKNTPLSKKCLVCGNMFCKRRYDSRKYWLVKRFCSPDCGNKSKKGKHCSPDTQFKKGRIFTESEKQKLRGRIPWNSGLKYSEELKSKLNLEGLKKGIGWFRGKKRPNISGQNSSLWVQKILRPCFHCKKELSLAPNQVNNRNFCNRKCWSLGTRGEGNPGYLGDKAVVHIRKRVRELAEYKEWRKACLTRDNWTCQECGFRNKGKDRKTMDVDHIKRFSAIVRENAIISIDDARNCSLLWDISNGRTICRPCHLISDTFGTKGLKKSQQ